MMKLIENFPLKEATTMYLDVKCRYLAEYSTIDELLQILDSPTYRQSHYAIHIGGGSNLVFTKDFDGMLLHSDICFISTIDETDSEVLIEAGAGVKWDNFVKYCIANNYYGAENMSGIPGEVGASAVQNIGSYGTEVCDIITRVNCIDRQTGQRVHFDNQECHYAYRDSIFKNEYSNQYVVTSVEYRLSKIPKFTLTYGPLKELANKSDLSMNDIRSTIISTRNSKLPNPDETGSVGSFFKNPIISQKQFETLKEVYPTIPHYQAPDGKVKVPAGWLIENAGLKGFSIGGALVYPKQCLVIANNGNATPGDVVALYRHVTNVVGDKYGIELHPEANII